jgi:NodT family efflux transporter outer membrane factor (OMF) lipoprotein
MRKHMSVTLAQTRERTAGLDMNPAQSSRREYGLPKSLQIRHVTGAVSLALLTACSAVGPDYKKPDMNSPANWKTEPGWQVADPKDQVHKGKWWEIFADPELNRLEEQTLSKNNNLAVAQARLDQAKAQTASANSFLFPRLGLTAGSGRSRDSNDRPITQENQTYTGSVRQSDFNAGLNVSYELDLAGRIRRQIEGAKATEQQLSSDYQNTQLILSAQLAISYFSLRELDTEISLVREILSTQKNALAFVSNRYELGASSQLEVEQQRALLSGTEAQLQTLADQRAKFEHAIATLIGVPASNFTLAESATLASPPQVPLVQPSHLLERRPDIASAERAVAVANAQIGIAKAGYFPTLNLGGVYGSDSNNRTLLFSTPAMLWSLGLSATQTVFDAGRTQAGVNAAKAANTQAVAAYKQTVLNAFEEVENALSSQKALMDASTSLGVALNSSKTAWSISKTRYEGGASSQLEYLLAQQSYLGYARQDVQNKGQQLINSVVLVKALGGGWSAQPIDEPQAQPAKNKAAGNAANAAVGDSAKVK